MDTYRKNYIVKAKNENSEIKSEDDTGIKYIVKCVALTVMVMIIAYFYIKEFGNWIIPTVFGILFIFAILGASWYTNTWKVFTQNGKLYIKRYFFEKEIDYSCLATIEILCKRVKTNETSYGLNYIYFLTIRYVDYKKEKVKTIKLQMKEEMIPEVKKFCQMFMTNIQAEEGYDESFLDVREENSLPDRIIKEYAEKELEKKEKEPKLKIIVIIIGLIILFMMMASIPIIENMQK